MLKQLTVKNFALFKDTELELLPGFTAVTGETGAGKSLFAGAIAFLAGGKPNFAVVRDGARFAVVEGEFRTPETEPIIIRREITAEGRSRIFLQDSPIKLKELLEVAQPLVDITSQRAFSHLLEPAYHLEFLDRFAQLQPQRLELEQFEQSYNLLNRQIRDLQKRREQFTRERDIYLFQIKEIEAVNPLIGEDEEISAELHRLEHLEEIYQNGAELTSILGGDEHSVEHLLGESKKRLEILARLDRELADLPDELANCRSILREINRRVETRTGRVHFDPDKLEQLRLRLQAITTLVRKFGGSIPEVLSRLDSLKKAVNDDDRSDQTILTLQRQQSKLVAEWCGLAEEVGVKRSQVGAQLANKVLAELAGLGMPKARFEVRLNRTPVVDGLFVKDGIHYKLERRGAETAEFYLSANPGIAPNPLEQIASGGELSRVMLALKLVQPADQNEPLVLFDEIDSGVSGAVAQLVGYKLRQIAVNRQLLAITHLPQIAALAENHLSVSKRVTPDGKTETALLVLDREQREREIATLLSGGTVTPAALEQARNLITG